MDIRQFLGSKSERLLSDLERRVDEAFARLIHVPWRGPGAGVGWEPAIDVRETQQEYLVLVDLPGVLPEEVQVEVEDQTLVVHGRRTSRRWTQAGTMVYTERFEGEFVRRIPLPGAVDRSRVQVSFVQGLLLIRLPKALARPLLPATHIDPF